MPFVNCRQFMYLVISLLVLRAGCGIWLYQFLIIAYLFTLSHLNAHVLNRLLRENRKSITEYLSGTKFFKDFKIYPSKKGGSGHGLCTDVRPEDDPSHLYIWAARKGDPIICSRYKRVNAHTYVIYPIFSIEQLQVAYLKRTGHCILILRLYR